ncbi:MAG: carbohydrate binding family 9 domain-containing protein, partial [Bacteroidetes bacterium]|nr:carbohydrate binding family 9 domain-containing protein [Bacteroidota bacterium]
MKLLATLIFFLPLFILAQNRPGTTLHIRKAKENIQLDGVLDEPAWQEAEVAKNWFLNYPVDTMFAPFQTEARVTFDDEFFYFSLVCYDDSTPDLIHSLRRDFEFLLNDQAGINIGPYNDKLNGFFFSLTPAGVQREGILIGGGGGGDSFNQYWDNKWYSKVVRHKDKWIAEAAIPFKSIRYKAGLREWNIIFDRSDKKRNQISSWISTPIQYNTGMFAYSGQLIWLDPPPPPGLNMSFIPYLAGGISKDNSSNPPENSSDFQAGFDAKIGLSPSLNLDLAVNPDFSQVEVDQQVINLTRFEFRFPERRQLFLENSDLFSRAGVAAARVFFSRRVGLVRDSTGLYRRIPILYGARVSGSLDQKWRLSVLNAQTKEQLSIGLPAQNFTVATVQRNFGAQSSVSVTYVNKQSLGVDL